MLSERLFKKTEELWKSYLEHPFIKGIADGSLDLDRFKFYMIQDYRYLLEYSKVFAYGIIKSSREDIMRRFASMVNETLDGEMKIHKKYMARLGITPEEIENSQTALLNQSYTSYMMDVASRGDCLDVLVSVLSCAWSYEYIGKNLAAKGIKNENFSEWIEGYSSEEYIASTKEIIDLVDELGADISESRAEKLEQIFVNCGRYEYDFWNMSYNKEM